MNAPLATRIDLNLLVWNALDESGREAALRRPQRVGVIGQQRSVAGKQRDRALERLDRVGEAVHRVVRPREDHPALGVARLLLEPRGEPAHHLLDLRGRQVVLAVGAGRRPAARMRRERLQSAPGEVACNGEYRDRGAEHCGGERARAGGGRGATRRRGRFLQDPCLELALRLPVLLGRKLAGGEVGIELAQLLAQQHDVGRVAILQILEDGPIFRQARVNMLGVGADFAAIAPANFAGERLE